MEEGETREKGRGLPVCGNDGIGFEVQLFGLEFVFYFRDGGFVFLFLKFATHFMNKYKLDV